jgi:hypothetical protein
VRGDWRQDFYAKSLALVGLGVLAGIGALVDYWPAQLDVPEVAALVMHPAAPKPLAVGALPAIHVTLNTDVPVAPAPRAARPAARHALAVAAVSGDFAGVTSVVPISPAPPPSTLEMAPAAASTIAAAPIALSEPPAPSVLPGLSALVPEEPPAESSGNFLASAFRKTGSSIVAVGVKTGESIAGAFGLFGRVVTKLKFF